MIDGPTLGDASYNGAVESTNGMTSAVESANTIFSIAAAAGESTAASAVFLFAQMQLTKTTHSW